MSSSSPRKKRSATSTSTAASTTAMSNAGRSSSPAAAAAAKRTRTPQSSSSSSSNNNKKMRSIKSAATAGAAASTAWLDQVTLSIPDLSLAPMTGRQLLQMLQERLKDVHSCYLPCVAFLVTCQQDLRQGVEQSLSLHKNTKSRVGQSKNPAIKLKKSLQQYYTTYIAPLPQKFAKQNRNTMLDTKLLSQAVEGLDQLSRLAKQQANKSASSTTFDTIKQTFLGGMHEGRSNGLRQWLSQHGQALPVCTFLECLLRACMERVGHNNNSHSNHLRAADDDETGGASSLSLCKQFIATIRPLAQQCHHRLVSEIPTSYQTHTTGHPYLPFFHRLEAALRGVATYDPDDEDVVCISTSSLTTTAAAASATTTTTTSNHISIDATAASSRTNGNSTSVNAGDKKVAASSKSSSNNNINLNLSVPKNGEIISIDDDDEDDDDVSDNDNDDDNDDEDDDSAEESGEMNSSNDGNDHDINETQEIISIHDSSGDDEEYDAEEY